MVLDKIKKLTLDDRIRIESDTWQSARDEMLPFPLVNPRGVPHFVEWINFNRFAEDHRGLDFAAYVNKFGEAVLGLPRRTVVHAVADGVVVAIHRHKHGMESVNPFDPYFDTLLIAHGRSNSKRPSIIGVYSHVTPMVKEGQFVSRGQKIGRLYCDLSSLDMGRLVHLHFGLANYDGDLHWEDPEILFPDLMKLTAYPQRIPGFSIVGHEGRTDVRLANFSNLLYGSADLMLGIRNQDFSAPRPTYRLVERLRELT